MLLTDAQVALNEVHVCCLTAAARYADAADRVDDVPGVRLRALGLDRERFATQLEREMRTLDILPRAVNREAEDLHRLGTHLKAAVAGDEIDVLADSLENAEAGLQAAAEEALRHDLPLPIRQLLQDLRDTADRARVEVASLRQNTRP